MIKDLRHPSSCVFLQKTHKLRITAELSYLELRCFEWFGLVDQGIHKAKLIPKEGKWTINNDMYYNEDKPLKAVG